ncbi:MAG: hypothetical protein HUJ56_06600 [Erysipelotrichaceae bacterium]|nr:hypothetical protein [Erysipelotrichaceae bacterium]
MYGKVDDIKRELTDSGDSLLNILISNITARGKWEAINGDGEKLYLYGSSKSSSGSESTEKPLKSLITDTLRTLGIKDEHLNEITVS